MPIPITSTSDASALAVVMEESQGHLGLTAEPYQARLALEVFVPRSSSHRKLRFSLIKSEVAYHASRCWDGVNLDTPDHKVS